MQTHKSTYRTLDGTGPLCLRDIIGLYKPNSSAVLRSDVRLDVPWSNLAMRDRAFSVAAPAERNN